METARNTKTPTYLLRSILTLTAPKAAKQLGIKEGVESNYISTGNDLVLIDSPEGLGRPFAGLFEPAGA